MTDFFTTPVSREEYDAMMRLIAQRIANLAYALSHQKAREALAALGFHPGSTFEYLRGTETITLNFPITVIFNDLVEIVSGLRRMKDA